MFSAITGTIATIKPQAIIVHAAPFHFEFLTPQPYIFELGAQTMLHTYLHWNQEQGPALFAFASEFEKETFLLVISCSGIGPKMGLAVLAKLEPAIFLQAIAAQDLKVISSVSGIGLKKAEQMCLHLKDKVDEIIQKNPTLATGALSAFKDVQDTLTSLNYSPLEIKTVLQKIKTDATLPANAPFDLLLRKALTHLAK